jgi:hypothetical protein
LRAPLPGALAQLMLISTAKMKNFLILLLIVTAVCYYFDISPTDFLPTVQHSSTAVREKHGAAEQTAAAIAQPNTTASPPEGSLASRWSPEPSPKKP